MENSDHMEWKERIERDQRTVFIILAVIFTFVFAMIVAFCIYCCKNLKEERVRGFPHQIEDVCAET